MSCFEENRALKRKFTLFLTSLPFILKILELNFGRKLAQEFYAALLVEAQVAEYQTKLPGAKIPVQA